MSKLYINGGKRLSGEISVHGAKNSVLPIMAATLLCNDEVVIHNCPNLSDVDAAIKILEHLGCSVEKNDGTVVVNSKLVNRNEIPDALMREMRSSIVFLGAIIGRLGGAVVSSPGGCELGPRPIDLHLSALRQMGLTINEDHGNLYCTAENGLVGTDIHLLFPSVGATENIILAATLSKGATTIHNAAKEPEISDLADFLNGAGARIYGAGSDIVTIYGVERLGGTEHTIIPDRIVTATYICAAAVTNGDITIKNVMPSHLVVLLNAFKECGCEILPAKSSLRIRSNGALRRIPTIRTTVYPGFPTDAGPPIIAMLSLAKGTSVFVENIFQNRYKYIDELKRLGANIKIENSVAVIEGVNKLSSAKIQCTDLRGGAALVVAALAAEGESEIDKIYHIDRGYEKIENSLSLLGAEIKRN